MYQVLPPQTIKRPNETSPLKPSWVSTVTPHQSQLDRGRGVGVGEDFKDFLLKFYPFFLQEKKNP